MHDRGGGRPPPGRAAPAAGLPLLAAAGIAAAAAAPAAIAFAHAQSAQPDAAAGDVKFLSPMGISIHHDGSAVYVTVTGGDRIQVFNYTGGFNHTFGSNGSGGEQFLSPAGVDVTKKTRPANMRMVAVADTGSDCISVWHVNGTFAFDFGSEGSGEGNSSSPWGVAMNKNQEIFVADTGNDRVQLFESDGEYARRVWGSHGSGSQQLDGPRLIDEAGALP